VLTQIGTSRRNGRLGRWLIRWLDAVVTARGVGLASRYAPRGEVTES
jgi:hypothetical protein